MQPSLQPHAGFFESNDAIPTQFLAHAQTFDRGGVVWGVITAKIEFGILLCCFPIRFLTLLLVVSMFSMMFAKTSLLFCYFCIRLFQTSMLLFVSVCCYAKPRYYYSCLYAVVRNLDAIIRVRMPLCETSITCFLCWHTVYKGLHDFWPLYEHSLKHKSHFTVLT